MKQIVIATILAAVVGLVVPANVALAADQAARPGGAITTLRVGLGAFDPLPLYAALDRGFFAREGIAIEIIRLGTTPANISAVVGGSEELAFGDILAWTSAVGNGFKIQLVAGDDDGDPSQSGGYHALLVSPSSGIKTPADLRGKSIGVSPTPLTTLETELWLEKNGVDPATVKFVPVAPQIAMAGALKKGSVDAIFENDPFTQQAVNDYGFVPITYPSRQFPLGATSAAFFSTTAWLQAHPDVAKRFAAAIRDGAHWANTATPEDKAAVLAKYSPLNLTQLETKIPGIVKSFHYAHWIEGPINLDLTQQWVDTAAKHGALDKAVQIKDAIYPTALAPSLR